MSVAKKLWLTYAWADNENSDVEFIAQEIECQSVTTLIDRHQLIAGQRLWQQIGDQISNPEKCDAWAFYVTENSLASEPCREELEYAVGRALQMRGGSFPVIGIFPTPLPSEILPASIRSRLYVCLTDDDWLERVRSGALGQTPQVSRQNIPPLHIGKYDHNGSTWIEARPRAGRWAPIILGVKMQNESVFAKLTHGPAGVPGGSGMAHISTGETHDNRVRIWQLNHNASPIEALHFVCKQFPIRFIVGNLQTAFEVDMEANGLGSITQVPMNSNWSAQYFAD